MRKPIYLLGAIVLPAVVASATITRVEVTMAACSDGVDTVTLGTPTTAGELIVVLVAEGPSGSAGGTLTDSASEAYTQDNQETGLGSDQYAVTTFYLFNSAPGVTSVTYKQNSSNVCAYGKMYAAHYTGIALTSAHDASANFGSGQASPWSSKSLSTSQPSELLVGFLWDHASSNGVTFTATGGWTLAAHTEDGHGDYIVYLDQIVSSTGSYAATGTSSNTGANNYAAISAFKGTASSSNPKMPARVM
jgi:hypothetical protein